MGQCTAKSKRTGERCRRAAMHGQAVCYMHGGASRRKGGAPRARRMPSRPGSTRRSSPRP
ncbi:HGGxSTG domain-containing protein [Bilophila wadsworthia]|uniref:HGGxSTG domain-containing protein n=1 Tax=Bilophila wadsworthia TaxID=35833 RepID=UPI0034633A54